MTDIRTEALRSWWYNPAFIGYLIKMLYKMKKPILILLLVLISSIQLLAIKKEGKIFYENHTIDVIFEIPLRLFSQGPNFKNMQRKMQYYDSLGNKKVLKPEQAKEIRFYYKNAEVRMLSRKNTLRIEDIYSLRSNIFLKLELTEP
jgi:hypothetical protein